MKIGVITFSNSKDNYGQMLQIYAMQCFLKKMGHECFLIRYTDSPKAKASFKWSKAITYLCRFPQYAIWYVQQKKERRQQKVMQLQLNRATFSGGLMNFLGITLR